MLQDDQFDDDEFAAPSMSEHGAGGLNNGHGSYGAESAMAGAAGMGAAGMIARNESGAPRVSIRRNGNRMVSCFTVGRF